MELLYAAVGNLKRRKLRTVLTVCSIAIGVMAMVLIFGISDYGKAALNQELESMGLGGIMISRDAAHSSDNKEREKELQFLRQQPGVEDAVPVIAKYSNLSMRNLSAETIIWGVSQGEQQMITTELLYGRLLQNRDLEQQSCVCVIDEALAQVIYKRSNIVGKRLNLELQGHPEEFEIVGVVRSGGNLLQNLLSGYIPYFVYIPYTTLQQSAGEQDFNQISVTLQQDLDAEEAGKRLVNLLNRQSQDNSYRFDNISTQTDKLKAMMEILSWVLAVIAAISLLIAGIGIMTIMLVSANERTREIGIKKAIGASEKMIRSEFLAEAFLISLVGGLIGLLTGWLILLLAGRVFSLTLTPAIGSCIAAFLFSIGVGVTFGYYPAVYASGLKPVDALKAES